MSERAGHLPWMVIRQDEDGSRYRIGRYATLMEARALAERLTAQSDREARAARNGREDPAAEAEHAGEHAAGSAAESGTETGRERAETRTVSATRVRRYVVERLDYPGGDHA